MNDFTSFNKALEYIDANLDSEIEPSEIYRITSYSYEVFARIFSIISGISLGDYIRSRKLSKAAEDLQEKRGNIAEIALIYGYSSSTSFSYAFKKFHGKSPSDVKLGQSFRIAQPLRLSVSIRGEEFDASITEKETFKLVGVSQKLSPNEMSMEVWQSLEQKLQEKLRHIKSKSIEMYGLYFLTEENAESQYMIGYSMSDDIIEKQVTQKGLTIIEIPSMKYAVLRLEGEVTTSIHNAWSYLIEVFLPQEGYKYADSYDLELYHGNDVENSDFYMELWVPIRKCE